MHQMDGFFESLFDCSFTRFITPKIIKFLYVLAVVLAAIFAVMMIVMGFNHSAGMGVVTLIILAPLYFVVSVLSIRVALEFIMVVFRIEENTARMAGTEHAHVPGQQTSVPQPIGESQGPQTSPPSI